MHYKNPISWVENKMAYCNSFRYLFVTGAIKWAFTTNIEIIDEDN